MIFYTIMFIGILGLLICVYEGKSIQAKHAYEEQEKQRKVEAKRAYEKREEQRRIEAKRVYEAYEENRRRIEAELNAPLNIRERFVSYFESSIHGYATRIIQSEYTLKRKPIYKKRSNGVTTKEYRADFIRKVDNEHYKIESKIQANGGHFSKEFIEYVETFYPFATVRNFDNILVEFISHPKKINKPKQSNQPAKPKTNQTTNQTTNVTTNNRVANNIRIPKYEEPMISNRFVRLSDINKFKNSFSRYYGFDEISGIYLICNASQSKWYIGQGQKAIQRCLKHFKSEHDNAPDIKKDWIKGDIFYINFIRLKDTDFNTLDELEYAYIGKYNSVKPYGYNTQRGNKTNQ